MGSAVAPFERAMVVSYLLSIVTIALSLTIRCKLLSNISDAQINRWVGHFGTKFGEEGVFLAYLL